MFTASTCVLCLRTHPPRGARWPVGGALEVRALPRRSAPAPRASIIIHHAKSRSMSSLRQGEDHCSASAAMSVGVSRTLERQLCLWRGCHCLFVEGGSAFACPACCASLPRWRCTPRDAHSRRGGGRRPIVHQRAVGESRAGGRRLPGVRRGGGRWGAETALVAAAHAPVPRRPPHARAVASGRRPA